MAYVNIAARVGQILMGVVFLTAGFFKIWEPVVFYWEALPFTGLLEMELETGVIAAKMAMFLGPLECALGLALLLNWRPRLTLGIAAGLMAGFTLLMWHAWRLQKNIDCGCFGSLFERTPGEAAVADVVMLGMVLFAWWELRHAGQRGGLGTKLVVGMAVLSLVIAGARYLPEKERLTQSDLQVGVRLSAIALKDIELDLLKGEYIVELFSPNCGHCRKAVPKMNRIADQKNLPDVVALHRFPMDSPEVAQFKKQLKPRYTIAAISSTDFVRLTWRASFPRLAYVREGVVQAVWESNEMPGPTDLEKAIYGEESEPKDKDTT
jgi:thiol-disulfide isomerase/thioredoxin